MSVAADDEISADVFADVVRDTCSVSCSDRRVIGRIVHRLEQVKKRENKDPNQIDKVPE